MKLEIKQVSPTFGKALPTIKKADYASTISNAKKVLGINNGISILKIHSNSMPTQNVFDTGVGKLNSAPAINFINTLSFYTGVNAVKVFPEGQVTGHQSRYYCPYLKTSITFGEENINLLNLVEDTKTYGYILSKEDIKILSDEGKAQDFINYENELGVNENYHVLKPLKIVFENYKNGLAPEKLQKEFEVYKQKALVAEKYPRLALYPYISKKEPELFENFEVSKEKQEKYNYYKEQYKDEIEFFQFRQFLAQKEHNEAKSKINYNKIDLFGDCLIGFSKQEIWANPDAFMKNTSIGNAEWGLPALNFNDILNPEKEAHKVFKDKVTFFLENYDGIRFDVGWVYALAMTTTKGKPTEVKDMGRKIYDLIEKIAFEVKGNDFNKQKLIYEMDGMGDLFTGWGNNPKVIPNVKDIVGVYTTQWQQDNPKDSWGNPDFLKLSGLSEDEFILGTNNHDGTPLRALAEGTTDISLREQIGNVDVLSKLFDIKSKVLLNNASEFIKAKFAQLFTVKNQFLFFIDVLGSSANFDDQSTRTCNYRFRVNKNFERQYHTALQQGFGFNLPETLATVFKQKGLNISNPELYKKLCEYGDYLREFGAKTEAEANADLFTDS